MKFRDGKTYPADSSGADFDDSGAVPGSRQGQSQQRQCSEQAWPHGLLTEGGATCPNPPVPDFGHHCLSHSPRGDQTGGVSGRGMRKKSRSSMVRL